MLIGFYVLFHVFFTGTIISMSDATTAIQSNFTGVVNFFSDLVTHFQSGTSIESVVTYVTPIDGAIMICALIFTIGVVFGLVALCKRIMSLWLLR